MVFWDPYTFTLALCFLASLSVFYKLKASDAYLKFFPPFLLAIFLVELLGAYLISSRKDNVWVYNFFTMFEFCFYGWMISIIIINKSVKNIIRIIVLFYALIATVNILFIQKITAFHSVTYSLGCLMIVVFCIYYFLEMFRFPRSINLSSNPAFWICAGLLFYYCCGFPLFALVNYWRDISKLIQKNFSEIFMILNVFLYSLFTIAFLCIRTRKYTLSPS